MSSPPKVDAQYKPGPAGREFLEELAQLKKKIESRPVYNMPKRKRKKNPQPKIDKCFPIAVNEDGYPLKYCEFEPLENKVVYRPPGYAEGYTRAMEHCQYCHLKPCVLSVYKKEAMDMELEAAKGGAKADKIAAETEKFFVKKVCKFMKRRYSRKVPVPECVQEQVDDTRDEWKWHLRHDEDDEDSDDDELSSSCENELVFNSSIDGGVVVEDSKGSNKPGVDCLPREPPVAGPSIEPSPGHGTGDKNADWVSDPPEWLLTQPFHGDSSTDDECEDAERAFVDGCYIPKTLVRDRDTGDAPLELVVEAHKARLVNQSRARAETRKATQTRKAVQKKAAVGVVFAGGSRKRFFVDLQSGLESDSSDYEGEIRKISQDVQSQIELIDSIMRRRPWR